MGHLIFARLVLSFSKKIPLDTLESCRDLRRKLLSERKEDEEVVKQQQQQQQQQQEKGGKLRGPLVAAVERTKGFFQNPFATKKYSRASAERGKHIHHTCAQGVPSPDEKFIDTPLENFGPYVVKKKHFFINPPPPLADHTLHMYDIHHNTDIHKTYVSSMIHSARPTIPPAVITILA